MAGMPPIRSGCPGYHQPGQELGLGTILFISTEVLSKSRVKHKDQAAAWAWEVTAAPQGSEHRGHYRHRTQWWPADVSGQAKSWFCCLSTAKKAGIALWVCTQTQGHDTYSAQGCYQLCVIWMDSPLETLNAEMLHRQRRWLKIFAWTPLNCPRTCSRHFFCGKNTDCIQRNLLQLHHLPSWCRTHPFNLSELHGEQLSASPTDEGIELSQPALSTLIKLLLSTYFISTA